MSANFGHLQEISPELHRLGVLAERFFAEDANTSLLKSRQFDEDMVKEIAALSGVYDPAARETTNDLLRRLATQQVLPREVADIFHAVRKSGKAKVRRALLHYALRRLGLGTDPGARKRQDQQIVLLNGEVAHEDHG